MKTLLGLATRLTIFALLLFAGLSSCSKDDDDTNPDVVVKNAIPLEGSQEVPVPPAGPVVTSATGSIDINYTKSTKALTFTARWNNLTDVVTGMHFHGPAARGANAPVIKGFAGFSTDKTGSFSGSATLTAAEETDFLAGKWYYNIHSNTYKAGELRGQIEF